MAFAHEHSQFNIPGALLSKPRSSGIVLHNERQILMVYLYKGASTESPDNWTAI